MSKLKIQKISNGQFCTAAQWYQDAMDACRAGEIGPEFFRLPDLTGSNPTRAALALAEMENKYPLITAAFKICVYCGIGRWDTYHLDAPSIRIDTDRGILMLHWTHSEYADIDAALRAHIDEQREIVRKHNLMEV